MPRSCASMTPRLIRVLRPKSSAFTITERDGAISKKPFRQAVRLGEPVMRMLRRWSPVRRPAEPLDGELEPTAIEIQEKLVLHRWPGESLAVRMGDSPGRVFLPAERERGQIDQTGTDCGHLPVDGADARRASIRPHEDIRRVVLAVDHRGWKPSQPFENLLVPRCNRSEGLPAVKGGRPLEPAP